MSVKPTFTVEAYLSGVWTNITADVDQASGFRIKYGIDANGPLDGMADPGEFSCALQNSAKASTSRPLGYYSPLHASVRSGWTWGVPMRVTLIDPTGGASYVKHRGKARVIDPMPGKYLERRVAVVSSDAMADLDEADVRSLSIQTDQTESQLIAAVLDSLPVDSQPITRNIDTGIDIIPYAFHDLGDGVKASGLINDIAVDSYALVFVKGDGTFTVRNRHTRVAGSSVLTLTDATERDFASPSSLDQAFNQVRVTIHPVTIDDTPTTVLYADQTVRSIGAGQTVEFWVSYSDPSAGQVTLIGGLNVVTAPVAGTDYAGNAQADGLGSDLTANITIAVTPFGSAALVSVTNSAGVQAFLVDAAGDPFLHIRGQGVYDLGPQTYEASSVQPYGTRPLSVDLRYQDSPATAQDYAEFLEAQRNSLADQPQMVAFCANNSAALMTQALTREPGDIITVSETMTGFTSVDAVIQSVELELVSGSILFCRWGLAPTAPFSMWTLDVSTFDSQTVLGF